MKTFLISNRTVKHVAVVALLGFSLLVRASEKTAAAVKPAEVVIPKSVFTDDPQLGKDPFFPNSTRRVVVPTRAILSNAPPIASSLGLLTLKGTSGTKDKPLALINSTTVAQGETAEIRAGLQIVKIKCLAIRDGSVLLELDGSKEQKEIRLRDGIY